MPNEKLFLLEKFWSKTFFIQK